MNPDTNNVDHPDELTRLRNRVEQHHCPCCGLPASDNAPDDPDICHKHPHCYVCWGREHDLVGDCIACKAGLR